LAALLVVIAAATTGTAQVARDTATTSYEVSGVKVIQRRTNTSNVVANLYLLGGVRQLTAQNAGIEALLLGVTERGTAKYPLAVLRRAMARTGSDIAIAPNDDWTLVGVRTTTDELDSTWSIFADRLMHPTLDAAEFEFIRKQLLSGLRQRDDSPDATLDYLADSISYAGQPYALSPVGTVQSISSISLAQLKAYHREQMVTSRMLLVVVGDVPRAKIESLVRTTIGKLPAGTYSWTMPAAGPLLPGDVVFAKRSLPTNYLQGYMAGPAANSPDAPALRVAAAILSGRFFSEIRSRRNLTYAVNANFRDRGLSSMGLYVTTNAPDTTVALMKTEIRALQLHTIPTENLRPLVAQFITEYFLDNETTTAQADFLARAQLYRGDFRAGERFVDELRAVTGADVQRAALLYLKNVRWAYVGDPALIPRERLTSF
jgi:zinc protease